MLLSYVLNQIKHQLVETYDISDELINNIFNHLDLSELEIIVNNIQMNDVPIGWEQDKCGHIMQHTSNGHRVFCNIPKNEHYMIEKDPELAHTYVDKTYDDTKYELNYILFKKIHQEKIDNVSHQIINQINVYVTEHFERKMFKIHDMNDDLIVKLNGLIKRYRNYCFKSNFIEYFDDVGYCTFYLLKKHQYLIVGIDDTD